MLAEEFAKRLYENALEKNITEFQIDYNYNSSYTLVVEGGKINKRVSSENQGVSFAVKNGKNIGKFDCEKLDEAQIPLIIEEAVTNAKLINCDEENFFYNGCREYPNVLKYHPINELYAKLDKEKYLLDMEKIAYNSDKRIKKVISVVLSEGKSKVVMKNSYGLDVIDEEIYAYAYIYLSAEDNGITKTASEMVMFDKEEDFNPQIVAQKAVKKALNKLDAVNIKSANMKVVFKNKTFGDFLETIGGIFSANAVQEKHSQLAGKLGQKVADELVSIIDDPLLKNGYGSRSFDGEGVPCRVNEVIKDGKLMTYLYNLRTAHKDGVESTGNGSGCGNRGISFSNFYIKAGKLSKDEVIKQAGTGVYVVDLNGLHAGYSSVSGDFSFGAEAFIIENGKIGKALNQITISGNVYKLLQQIKALGDDVEFNSSAFGAPTLLVENLAVSDE